MILWMDGFDTYGGGNDKMLDGVYADANTWFSTAANRVRTGSHALQCRGSSHLWRRIVGPTPRATIGWGAALYSDALPPDINNPICLVQFADENNATHVTIQVGTTGKLQVVRGHTRSGGNGGTIIAETAEPVYTAGAYQHLEILCHVDAVAGYVIIRRNNIEVLNATGLNTLNSAIATIAQVKMDRFLFGNGGGPDTFYDDMYCYDTTGTDNNGIGIGDCRVFALFPNADTAQADMTPSSGSVGYSLIDEAAPNDNGYIEAGVAGNTSHFQLQDLPPEVGIIKGTQITVRQHKTDAGPSQLRNGVVSNGVVAEGADRSLTTVPTYYNDVFEKDPNTNGPWTRAAINAALIRNRRTV